MTMRITDKHLDALTDRINKTTGSPMAPYERDENGRLKACIGNYHIGRAYGGVCLQRVMNEDGGVTCPLGLGHIPKRELYEQLHAYLRGLDDGKQPANNGE